MTVCALDGVPVQQTRMGRWVHLDELPEDVDSHEVRAMMSLDDWVTANVVKDTLAVVAAEMLQHHNALHPASACAFAQRLETVLRSSKDVG
jgi:hypothetical protein